MFSYVRLEWTGSDKIHTTKSHENHRHDAADESYLRRVGKIVNLLDTNRRR